MSHRNNFLAPATLKYFPLSQNLLDLIARGLVRGPGDGWLLCCWYWFNCLSRVPAPSLPGMARLALSVHGGCACVLHSTSVQWPPLPGPVSRPISWFPHPGRGGSESQAQARLGQPPCAGSGETGDMKRWQGMSGDAFLSLTHKYINVPHPVLGWKQVERLGLIVVNFT